MNNASIPQSQTPQGITLHHASTGAPKAQPHDAVKATTPQSAAVHPRYRDAIVFRKMADGHIYPMPLNAPAPQGFYDLPSIRYASELVHGRDASHLVRGVPWDPTMPLPTHFTPQVSDEHARHFQTEPMPPERKRGRPPGSGTYASADDFLQAVRPIIQRLRLEGVYPSQARVAQLLPFRTSVRQRQRWGEMHRLTWSDVLNSM